MTDRLRTVVIAVLTATAAGSLLMILAGASPLDVWARMAAAQGDRYGLGQLLFRATPLILTGLAVAVPLRAGLFNIGGEGQLTAAALACAVVAAAVPTTWPALLVVPLACAAAMAAGGAVGAATGALRVYRGAHEVIVAILLNAIVAGVALWLGNRGLFVGDATRTATIVPAAQLPSLGLAGASASVSAIGAVAAAAIMAWVLARTTVGFGWRMTGQGKDAARAAGLAVDRAQVTAMATAGALAGLAGAHFVLGHKHAFEEGLGRGTGYLGVAVALLGRRHPLGVLAAALAVAFFSHGGLVVGELVPKELTELLLGALVLAIAVAPTLVGWAAEAARAPGSTPTAASAEGPSA